MSARPSGERLAALERGLSDHERACEERLADIKGTVAQTETKIDKLQWWIVGLIVAVGAFALITLVAIVLHALKLA